MDILISAGPTLEPIDSVRYISNHSSGKMGVALAVAATRRGHTVTVVHGELQVPIGKDGEWIKIKTTQDLLDAMLKHTKGKSAVIMAAAVCDMRPKNVTVGKEGKEGLSLIEMEPTPDVAKEIAKAYPHVFKVAFSLENKKNIERSMGKLKNKSADWIVCNELASMGADESEFFVLNKNSEEVVPKVACSKQKFAEMFMDALEKEMNLDFVC